MTNATTQITASQIAKCIRVTDDQTKEVFYRVESEDGSETYTVKALLVGQKYFTTCSCKAGARAIACKHVRWAKAHAEGVKAEAAMAKAEAEKQAKKVRLMDAGLTEKEATLAIQSVVISNGKPASDEELIAIFGPRTTRRPSEKEIARDAQRYGNRGFSLLKR